MSRCIEARAVVGLQRGWHDKYCKSHNALCYWSNLMSEPFWTAIATAILNRAATPVPTLLARGNPDRRLAESLILGKRAGVGNELARDATPLSVTYLPLSLVLQQPGCSTWLPHPLLTNSEGTWEKNKERGPPPAPALPPGEQRGFSPRILSGVLLYKTLSWIRKTKTVKGGTCAYLHMCMFVVLGSRLTLATLISWTMKGPANNATWDRCIWMNGTLYCKEITRQRAGSTSSN